MDEQNIFDNKIFFEEYKALRQTKTNLNVLLEQPAMLRLLPDIKGKAVLDMGCGYGHNCINFISEGAERVLGIDISEKMLNIARLESVHERIEYRRMSIADISSLDCRFDLIYSSLAIHYVEDFDALAKSVYCLLNEGGCFLFSQEHPIMTATADGLGHWNRDENGRKTSYTFSNYGQPGKREMNWIIDGVIKFHRTLGSIITSLARAGFIIDTVLEPTPEPWAVETRPDIVKEFLKPNFLIVKAVKGC